MAIMKPTLTTLPTEILLEIYKHLYLTTPININIKGDPKSEANHSFALLKTCRAIHASCKDFLASATTASRAKYIFYIPILSTPSLDLHAFRKKAMMGVQLARIGKRLYNSGVRNVTVDLGVKKVERRGGCLNLGTDFLGMERWLVGFCRAVTEEMNVTLRFRTEIKKGKFSDWRIHLEGGKEGLREMAGELVREATGIAGRDVIAYLNVKEYFVVNNVLLRVFEELEGDICD